MKALMVRLPQSSEREIDASLRKVSFGQGSVSPTIRQAHALAQIRLARGAVPVRAKFGNGGYGHAPVVTTPGDPSRVAENSPNSLVTTIVVASEQMQLHQQTPTVLASIPANAQRDIQYGTGWWLNPVKIEMARTKVRIAQSEARVRGQFGEGLYRQAARKLALTSLAPSVRLSANSLSAVEVRVSMGNGFYRGFFCR